MLIRNTLLYMPAQVFGPLAQFASILVFTHWMAPEPYGVLTYVIASQDFVYLLSLGWWSQYTIRYFGGEADDPDKRYRDSETAIMAGTTLMQIAATFGALLFLSKAVPLTLFLASLFFTVTRCFNLHLGERARAQHHIVSYTIAQAAGPMIGFVAAFLAIAIFRPTPQAALVGYGIVQTAVVAWLLRRQKVSLNANTPDLGLLRQALGFGLPLIGASLAAWFSLNAIRIAVDHWIGPATMGLVAVGWAFGTRLMATAAMFVTAAAFPLAVEQLRRGSRDSAFTQITQNGLLMLAITLPAAVGVCLLEKPIVDHLVATPFRAMTLAVLPWALVAGLCRNIRTHVADQAFLLIERTPIVCAMGVVEMVFVVTGCMVGLVSSGAPGAAFGSAAGYAGAMVVHFAMARSRLGVRLPLAEAALIVVATAIMAAALSIMPGFGSDTIATIGFKIAIGGAVYVGALLALFPALTRGAWSRLRAAVS